MPGEGSRIERASTTEEALAWLERLKHLHQAKWTSRGELGAFARPFFGRFLQGLIERGLCGLVLSIFSASPREKMKSDICATLSIAIGSPTIRVDFGLDRMAGTSQALSPTHLQPDTMRTAGSACGHTAFSRVPSRYKASLCTGSEELHWYIYRPSQLIGLKKVLARVVNRLSW